MLCLVGDAQQRVLATPTLHDNLCAPARAQERTEFFFADAFPEQVGSSAFTPCLCSWCLSAGSSSSPLFFCSTEMAGARASSVCGTAGTPASPSPAKPAADGANPTTRGEEGEHAVKELCQQPGRASTWIQARRRDPQCPPGAIPRTQPKHTKAPEEPQKEKS